MLFPLIDVGSIPDAIQADEDSPGWQSDAHKNLPGFRELYKRFPKAKWYIMIDDDTYLIKTNLIFELNKYNSEFPWYFGLPNYFKGCDGEIIRQADNH